MGRKNMFGKIEMSSQEANQLKNLAEYGLSVDAEIASLKQKMNVLQREAKIWKQKYEKMKEQTKDFREALRRAPELMKRLVQDVLSSNREHQEKGHRKGIFLWIDKQKGNSI